MALRPETGLTASAPPAAPSAVQPLDYSAPKSPFGFLKRINTRMIILIGVALFVVGAPFYIWLSAELSGGIVDRGSYIESDIKAMSLFEMDQTSATMEDVPQQWRNLDGKRVQLIGQPWEVHSAVDGGVHDFQLCYSIAKCCFSGPPKVQHFIDCTAVAANGVDVPPTDMIKCYGILHVKIIHDGGKIKSLYQLSLDNVEPD
jgi:hypothetical protein